MHPEQYKKITTVVSTALELPPEQIPAYLEKACGSDDELRQEVEMLLNQEITPDFLEENAIEIDDPNHHNETQLKDKIGKIQLKHLIATGGMGEVYAGIDTVLKRPVAVKAIKAGYKLSSQGKSDFLNEAQILSSLLHPNICQVFDFFSENNTDILVLELITGKTLREALSSQEKIDVLDIAKQITNALVAAHERGIIHRDLKPENIMITDNNVVKILDFGLARLTENTTTPPLATNHQHPSQHTQIAGTPGYMSPEQTLGKPSSTATDLWSLGIILCELLSGRQPHPKNSTADELIARTKAAQYQIPKDIKAAETKLIQQLLAPNAEDRPSARSVLNEINRIQALPKRRIRMALAMSLLTLVLFSGWKYTTDLQYETNKANTARIEAEKLASFMLHDLHPQLRALGKLGLLESAATETLSYYNNLDAEQSQKTHDKQALALIKIASVFDDQGNTKKALSTYTKAKKILTQLYHEQPHNEEILMRYGQVHMNIGELLAITGDFDQSLLELKTAVKIGKKLTTNFPADKLSVNKPSTHDRWWLYLRATYMITDTYRRKGELDTALSLLSEVTPVAKDAAAKLPSLLSNYADISYMHCNTLYQIKIDQQVLKACIEMAQVSEQALQQAPDEFRLNFNHSIDLGFLAGLYRNMDQPEKALENIDKALAISHKLNHWDPDNQSTENDMISNMNIKGQLLFEQGAISASNDIFKDAYQRVLKLTEKNEELHFVHNKLHAEIYLNKLQDAQQTADYLKSKGMKTRDLLELFEELNRRQKKTKQ
ncbi:serine/threonine protein kinase [Marinicella rhabdoformis]|uniref:serine/threonine protein kinase n=1 Tax=Marinicella rhabdoformis TaxID=2580566 RepID=UPI0012AECAF9|nr:serine/threonine-protein kinase [Marinicella rhabdoformis]